MTQSGRYVPMILCGEACRAVNIQQHTLYGCIQNTGFPKFISNILETPKILGAITGALPPSKDFYIFLKALLVLHYRGSCCIVARFMACLLAILRRKNKTMTPAIKGNYLKQEILENKVLSIVMFETEWNGSCQIVAP